MCSQVRVTNSKFLHLGRSFTSTAEQNSNVTSNFAIIPVQLLPLTSVFLKHSRIVNSFQICHWKDLEERNSALTSSKRQPAKGMFSCSTAKCNAVRPDFCSWALMLTPAAIRCLRQDMLFAVTTMWIALRPSQNKIHPSSALVFVKFRNVRVTNFKMRKL